MLFLLDAVLFFNLFFAYKAFRYIISPPVLLGSGMLMSALIATLYYGEWEMDRMRFDTMLILGTGTVLFTIFCLIFRRNKGIRISQELLSIRSVNLNNLKFIVLVGIIFGIICCVLKIKFLAANYGKGFSLPELIAMAHVDSFDADLEIVYPKYIQWIGNFNNLLSYFVAWLLSIKWVTKYKDKYLTILLIMHTVVIVIDGLIGGTKAALLDPLLRFIFIFVFILYAYRRSPSLPYSFKKKYSYFSI